jgi:DNA-binding NarL/FixJ family response regulator
MSEIRVLLADDHPAIRAGLRAEMERAGGIRVVGEARDGKETLRLAAELQPDVVVLDMVLPGSNGIEVARRLRETQPGVRVLVLSGYDDEDLILGALEAGAAGYLLKEEEPGTIVAAVRAVARGEEGWYSRPVMAKVTAWARGKTSQPPERAELTEREVEVLRLVAQGWTNAHIASELGIRERTVAFHVENLLAKLGADNRTEAVVGAIRRGWGTRLVDLPLTGGGKTW